MKIEHLSPTYERVLVNGIVAGILERDADGWRFRPSGRVDLTTEHLQQLASYLAAKERA